MTWPGLQLCSLPLVSSERGGERRGEFAGAWLCSGPPPRPSLTKMLFVPALRQPQRIREMDPSRTPPLIKKGEKVIVIPGDSDCLGSFLASVLNQNNSRSDEKDQKAYKGMSIGSGARNCVRMWLSLHLVPTALGHSPLSGAQWHCFPEIRRAGQAESDSGHCCVCDARGSAR